MVLSKKKNKSQVAEEPPVQVRKRSLIAIKGQTLTKADYRGLLALILVLSYVYLALTGANCFAITALGPLTGSAVTYYFQSRASDSRDNMVVV